MNDRPTLIALLSRVRSDLLSRMSSDEVLRRSDTEVQARVLAGLAHGLYGFIDWVSRQIIIDTADSEYLERWASIWLITPRKPASAASGTVQFTVQAGAVIESGTVLQALDGTQYQTTEDAVITAPTATAPIIAVDEGESGNRTAGQTLTLISGLEGVQSNALASALTGGADIETDDALRARVLARIRTPPQGGDKDDYMAWALEVPGVTRAWVYPMELGVGTVTVRFVRDNDDSMIPAAADVAAVQAYLDARRPVTAQLYVLPPNPAPIVYQIRGLIPATAAVQAAVAAELADLHRREAVPAGTMLISHIRAAISAAAGETDYELVSPTTNITNPVGSIATFGGVTWL